MSRPCCAVCQRPKVACICSFTSSISNVPLVVVLLHPNEVNQSKGTLGLLAHSLKNCIVIEGEDFTDNPTLNKLLRQYYGQTALLYPSDKAVSLAESTKSTVEKTFDCKCLILLDGTWKKSYRMYMLSTNLHHIHHLSLPDNLVGQYQIRKTAKKNALSTLEACCYALSLLENAPEKYQDLLDKFVKFNQFQLSFRR